jgi:hypothetical protein
MSASGRTAKTGTSLSTASTARRMPAVTEPGSPAVRTTITPKPTGIWAAGT